MIKAQFPTSLLILCVIGFGIAEVGHCGVLVTTAADELDPIGTAGSGTSLREAMRDVPDGDEIVFDPAIFNGEPADVITLTLGRLALGGKSVTIDASAIPAGVTVSGGNSVQVFAFLQDATATLNNLTISGGRSGQGGGLVNNGTLALNRCRIINNTATEQGGGFQNNSNGPIAIVTLTECVVAGNAAPFGAGGLNVTEGAGQFSTAVLRRSTFSGNAATIDGGGFENYASAGQSSLTVEQSTFAGNSAVSVGGGIMNFSNGGAATTELRQSTITGNSAALGRGLRNNSSAASFVLSNTLLAANPTTGQPDAYGLATSLGGNLIGNGFNFVMAPASGDQIGTTGAPIHPLLGPLNNYGGPTKAIALLAGSPARDAGRPGAAYGLVTDQRGFARSVGDVDVGAYEAGTLLSYNSWSCETLPLSLNPADYAATQDSEQDGRNNALEYASLSSPLAADGGSPLVFTRNAGGTLATVVIPLRLGAGDLLYIVERNTALTGTWTAIGQISAGSGTVQKFDPNISVALGTDSATITDPAIAGQPRAYYRLRVEITTP